MIAKIGLTPKIGLTAKTGLAALALGLFAMAPAIAQTTAPGSAGSKNVIPEKQGASMEGRSDSLSTKLNKSDGVIQPPGNIDPGMHVPAPDPHPNSMPVIPPSATDGSTAK